MNVVTNVYYTEQGEIERYTTGLPPMPDPKPGQSVITLQQDDMWINPSLCYVEGGALREMPPRPSEGHTFDYANKQWVDPRTLSDLQAAKWAQIKRDRDEAEFGGFTWDGSPFDSDAISQSRIQGAVQLAAMAPGVTIDWTLANNSVRNLSAADLANVGAALGMHVAAQHAKARTLRSQIEVAATKEEVEAVVW